MCFVDHQSIETACSIWPGWDRGVGGGNTGFRRRVRLWWFFGVRHGSQRTFLFFTFASSALVWRHLRVWKVCSDAFCEDAVISAVRLCVPGSLLHRQGILYRAFLIPRHLFDSFFSSILHSWYQDTSGTTTERTPSATPRSSLGLVDEVV
ncbi:hypothetical protein BGZ61DRAFT_4175 [Ilyonectria robusta]|uniref:uncharacterized protein n=1 Tax=Ilyonectria robusta TaxID=1079257 RepID=UPI001E8D3923|nr:uncharacterized protein BGZ61DRAFT_4175 [Ilyonectria robusta]KAH8736841.1 hypothetical protein BGZ61DRAFT_4175 [Ilyonectria robusta]